MSVKAWMKSLLGPRVSGWIRYMRYRKRPVSQAVSLQETFTAIYRKGAWGGGQDDLCSGEGSTNEGIVQPYIEALRGFLGSLPSDQRRLVDLGCGDFRVSRQLIDLTTDYTGIDIVQDVVDHNNRKHGGAHVRFRQLDITAEPLPEGDVCTLRQILQHLSNQHVAAVLQKALATYRYIVITEHQPRPELLTARNLDKMAGADIRAYFNSGIYLDAPPFSIPSERLRPLVKVPGHSLGEGVDPGEIVTVVVKGNKD
ncbi:MAG TPA: class I SAM-dependent methyltransferase [Kiritimatiellia bacterium]|nr:class I SAM-dependent methyltransferase [Kiritimatiellia bacterium]HMP34379.1 class I SAM-dependent methyltransferase [Kiritimatiellia bacterium]